jgi:drug/metabolite transporter (DMT)-like permease
MAWMVLSGLLFVILNTVMRDIAQTMNPLEVQALRYTAGIVVMLPLFLRTGLRAWRPASGWWGQVRRGMVHTSALVLWFSALPYIPIADTTAIGFTTPIFVMIGAVIFLGEKMIWERWVAAIIGTLGVLVVVGRGLSGSGGVYTLLMLGSSPLMAGSYLISKALTKHDKPTVIVAWQSITVALLSFPLALLHWTWPTQSEWLLLLGCGAIGSSGHYCLTRAFIAADITATQPAKFLDLGWSALAGYLVFAETPSRETMIGAAVIFAGTTWLARRERKLRQRAASA